MPTLKDYIKENPKSLIARAYTFAEKAHRGQKRKNDEPYFNHVAATGQILYSWKLDEASVAAGLLHDTVEDTPVTLEQLKKEFGEEIAFLVDGVTKLGRIKYRGVEARVENLRKLFLALSQDLRVVFIKLADRLHNMQTLSALPPQKQKRIALETDEIYAPIAYRLGMQSLSGELHDLCFPFLHPKEDRWLKVLVSDRYEERRKYLERIKPALEEHLAKAKIKSIAIDFRAKRYSSLYHKLLRHEMDIERIYDLVAMRIILNSIADCYTALGVIHQMWPPLPGRIKDYIAIPKPNGYRSLHTTVIGPDGKYIELQIRTKEMHDENENGIAAHWLYEQNKSSAKQSPGASIKGITEEVKWVQQLREWQEKYEELGANSDEFLQSMKVEFFKNRIFAITPKGDVIDLPTGSTPVDFAYAIHTEIGDSCVGAKVNNKFSTLDHLLQNGDMVEILTQKNKKPSEDWLDFIKTPLARDHIRAALRGKENNLRGSRQPTRVEFRILGKDRAGLLKSISDIFARSHHNILSINTLNQATGNFPTVKIQTEIMDKAKIEKLILKIRSLKDIKEVTYLLV